MENVLLTIHLILALLLIGVVLLQRNEGGALLSGGGAMTARGAANALTRLTWIFAGCFIATSVALTVVAAQNARGTSVVDLPAPAAPPAPTGDLLPPPAAPAPATGGTAP
jgi:preprotein translocase subunit SecG